jgi:S-formylglutathione hydrolase FrmB
MPDCFTSLGGNQYIDSAALGGWARFLTGDMIPAIEARFPVVPGRDRRGVFGKSSGGYGAIAHGMLYPEAWGAIACHSGDMGFDRVYQPQFVSALDRLTKAHGRPIRDRAELDVATGKFLSGFDASAKVDGGDFHHLMTLAMAATYDPQADAPRGVRLPLDPWTAELDLVAWERWLAHDPVRLVLRADVVENLRSLRGIWLDCGWKDQYAIHYGTRQLSRELASAGIEHRHEEFEDDHSSVNYRMDESLPWLYQRLSS